MNEAVRVVIRAVTPAAARRQFHLVAAKRHMVVAYGGIRRSPQHRLRYLLFDRELSNFTYELANHAELAGFISDALGSDSDQIARYIEELAQDQELDRAVRSRLAGRDDRNPSMPFGRRLGWYALARAMKPRVVIETGIHDGLGSIALLRALERNDHDGSPGELISFDVEAQSGWLIPDWLRSRHTIVIADALQEIPGVLAARQVGLFIHDSDHRYEHETAEFDLIAGHLASPAALISDNAHAGSAFLDFCERQGFDYRFWKEVPRNHFYPGAGIGLAIVDRAAPTP